MVGRGRKGGDSGGWSLFRLFGPVLAVSPAPLQSLEPVWEPIGPIFGLTGRVALAMPGALLR